jgi:glycosyltransferase involved in cell wall biosynthesis
MRLLHVNAAYAPFLGGAEVYTQAISERFARDGDHVTLVTTNAAEVEYFWNPRKRHVPPGCERLNEVNVVRCRVAHLPLSPWSFYLLRRLATSIARLVGSSSGPWPGSDDATRWALNVSRVLWRLAPYMPPVPDIETTLAQLSGPFDVVHGVNIALEWPLLAAWRYARRRGLPFVVTPFVHVGEPGRRDVLINYVMPHQLEALRDADAVIVQTEIERRALAGLGVADERLHRLGMGVDLQQLKGGNADRFRKRYGLHGPIATFLGVVTYDKGSFHLVQAVERLWDNGCHVHLAIAGPPVDEFLRFHERLAPATRERVVILGPVLGQDKLDLLAATDVFVLPSRIDSFGIVYLEAWACGKPVIGARAGGVPDVIEDGVDGLLVDFGDVAGLSSAIQTLLDNPQQAQRLGRRGQDKVEIRYTWDRIYSRLRALYEPLVS